MDEVKLTDSIKLTAGVILGDYIFLSGMLEFPIPTLLSTNSNSTHSRTSLHLRSR